MPVAKTVVQPKAQAMLERPCEEKPSNLGRAARPKASTTVAREAIVQVRQLSRLEGLCPCQPLQDFRGQERLEVPGLCRDMIGPAACNHPGKGSKLQRLQRTNNFRCVREC